MVFGPKPEEVKKEVKKRIEEEGLNLSKLTLPVKSPDMAEAGSIYFDVETKAIRVYDGKTWRSVRLD
jgi:hypothetical protein